MARQPRNLKRDELLAHAQAALERLGPGTKVFFKYTCAKCGERVMFDTPNYLFETGTCCACGYQQKVTEGGYMLDLDLTRRPT